MFNKKNKDSPSSTSVGRGGINKEREENIGEIVALCDFDEQPAAYDVDKVVEQLNELKEYDVCANISCETCSYTGQCWEGERGQKVAIDRAVEIAKGGGIEW